MNNNRHYNELYQATKDLLVFCLILMAWGGFLNLFAVMHNDGRMPVYGDWGEGPLDLSRHYSFYSFHDVVNPLTTDIFYVSGRYFSIGDLLIWYGEYILFCSILLFGSVLIGISLYDKVKDSRLRDRIWKRLKKR